MIVRAHVKLADPTPDDAHAVRVAVDAWGVARTPGRVVALVLAAFLTLATASAQKDFQDVTAGLFRALEVIERPCAWYGISPHEVRYSSCGIILDALAINRTIIERHFEEAGYRMLMPWEAEWDPDNGVTGYTAGFTRPERGTLAYLVYYAEDTKNDESGIIIVADWP